MRRPSDLTPAAWGRLLLLALWVCCTGAFAQGTSADALRDRFAAVRAQSGGKLFDRPIYLQSVDRADSLHSEVYAVVDHPFDMLHHALVRADHWCDILILHLNVKYCRASETSGHDALDVALGRKYDQPLASAHWATFDYRVEQAGNDYLDVRLQAPTGPLGTKDFRILLQAAPLTDRQSLVYMTYAYSFGAAARWATQVYLSTVGSDKVGFSTVGRGADGQPTLVGGVRGMLERNTMRYYLAVDAASHEAVDDGRWRLSFRPRTRARPPP